MQKQFHKIPQTKTTTMVMVWMQVLWTHEPDDFPRKTNSSQNAVTEPAQTGAKYTRIHNQSKKIIHKTTKKNIILSKLIPEPTNEPKLWFEMKLPMAIFLTSKKLNQRRGLEKLLYHLRVRVKRKDQSSSIGRRLHFSFLRSLYSSRRPAQNREDNQRSGKNLGGVIHERIGGRETDTWRIILVMKGSDDEIILVPLHARRIYWDCLSRLGL